MEILTQLLVSNTLISDNGNNGIAISTNGSGTTTGVLDHVEMENNANNGLPTQSAQTLNVTVSDSVSANNGNSGVNAAAVGGGGNTTMVRNSTIANNGENGLEANGTSAGSTVFVTRSTITGNNTGWADVSSGLVLSYGDNNIDGNGSVNTAPPCVNGTSPCSAYK